MPLEEMPMASAQRLGVLLLLGLFGAACGDPCEGAEDRLVPLSELPCNSTSSEGIWESHPFPPITDAACQWLEFRACSTYEIEHPLGRVPSVIIGYTAFDADGEFATVGSGNSFIVQGATESTFTIRNAQNQLFYLRLVAD
jgi:hypothetical protein